MSTPAVPSLNIARLPTHENQSLFSLSNAITRFWAIYLALDYKEKSTQCCPWEAHTSFGERYNFIYN